MTIAAVPRYRYCFYIAAEHALALPATQTTIMQVRRVLFTAVSAALAHHAEAGDVPCKELFPVVAGFAEAIAATDAHRDQNFERPVVFPAAGMLSVEQLLQEHGEQLVDVRYNAEAVGRIGFGVVSSTEMTLAKSFETIASADPNKLDRPLIFTDRRPGIVTAIFDTVKSVTADSILKIVDLLRANVMFSHVLSFSQEGHGLPWHVHDESW